MGDPLSGALEERSVTPMLMLSVMEVDTDSHTMPYLETLSSQDLPQLDIIQEEFLAVESAPLHHTEDGDMTTMLSLDIPLSDDPELDTIQEVFSAVKSVVSFTNLFEVTNSKMLKTQLC